MRKRMTSGRLASLGKRKKLLRLWEAAGWFHGYPGTRHAKSAVQEAVARDIRVAGIRTYDVLGPWEGDPVLRACKREARFAAEEHFPRQTREVPGNG